MENKLFKSRVFPLGIIVISFILYLILAKINFIPLINNTLISLAFLLIILGQILLIFKLYKFKLKKPLKLFLILSLIGLMTIFSLYTFLYTALSFKSKTYFTCKGKIYYYNNISWLDPAYEIYEKDRMLTMKKLGVHHQWINLDQEDIGEELAAEILSQISSQAKFRLPQDLPLDQGEVEVIVSKEENPQDLVDRIAIEDMVKIENSSLALACVDKAMASSRWFLVEVLDEKMTFISELEETSPGVGGRMDSQGVIYLEFRDISSNVYKYKSLDRGLTWQDYK